MFALAVAFYLLAIALATLVTVGGTKAGSSDTSPAQAITVLSLVWPAHQTWQRPHLARLGATTGS